MIPEPSAKEALIEAFRAAAHRQLDQWVDQQTGLLTAPELPTLRQMSAQFTKTRTTLLGGCLQEMVLHLTASYQQQEFAPCPCCGKILKRHSVNGKTVYIGLPSPPVEEFKFQVLCIGNFTADWHGWHFRRYKRER